MRRDTILLRALLTAMIGGLAAAALWGATAGAAPMGASRGASPPSARHDTGGLTWSVEPLPEPGQAPAPDLVVTAKPGAVVVRSYRVVNSSAQSLALQLGAADVQSSELGSLDVVRSAARPVDVGAWVTIGPDRVVLAPQEERVVTASIAVPRTAAAGDHIGAVVARLDGTVTASDGHAVPFDRWEHSLLTVRVAGPLRPQLSIEGLALRATPAPSPLRTSHLRVRFVVRNTGNIKLEATPTVCVDRAVRPVAACRDLGALPVLYPGASVERIVDFDAGWVPLWARARVRLVSAGSALSPATATSEPVWNPRWAGGVLACVLIAAAGAVLWQRRRHHLRGGERRASDSE